MKSPQLRCLGVLVALAATGGVCAAADSVTIKVYPTLRRSIGGVSELDRDVYFAMSHGGAGFDSHVRSEERMKYLLDDLDITFGRALGPVRNAVRWSEAVREDAERPGFADLEHLKETCLAKRQEPGELFKRLAHGRLNVAAHEAKGAFPDFIGKFESEKSKRDPDDRHDHSLPENVEAAAELTAAVLEYNYSDFDRPAYYEAQNEPHWSFIGEPKLAEWHLATQRAVRARGLDVLVGGPCNSVAYFYKRDFGAFDGLKRFIKNTDCELDFYSFHAYDYFNWNGDDLVGRISSGLPLEGVLDLIQAHTVAEYGKQVDLVISEQGGYITGSGDNPSADEVGDLLGEKHFPGDDGFERTLRKRSISSHLLVSSVIANTMTFMEHPHVVKKVNPFILLESMAWDPRYYSTMYVPHEFTDKTRWVETSNTDFYKFFRGLRGRRAVVIGSDPDLQVAAFVEDQRLHVVINNLSDEPHPLDLDIPQPERLDLRRYARGEDYCPRLTESETDSVEGLTIAGREAVFFTASYDRAIPERGAVDEVPCYAEKIAVRPNTGEPARFVVETPPLDGLKYATLRIGVTRPPGADPGLIVKFNRKRVEVPLEDAAERLDNGESEYASTKLVRINRSLVREKNRIEVAFPDDAGGAIGSVVLRVGLQE